MGIETIAIAALVAGTAVSVQQQTQANKAAKSAAAAQAKAAEDAAKAVKQQQIAASQSALGSVTEKTGKTLGDAEAEAARQSIKKKRLGTTKLRIEPLASTGTSTAASGVSTTGQTGLKV